MEPKPQHFGSLITLLLLRLVIKIAHVRYQLLGQFGSFLRKTIIGKVHLGVFFVLASLLTQCPLETIEHVCPNENVTFWLYNNALSEPYQLDESVPQSLKDAPIIPYQPIKILIHGFDGNKNKSPNKQIRPQYMDAGFNVISVDYKNVARLPCYLPAVRGVGTVGLCVAEFILKLIKFNSIVKDRWLHIIGFSLGTHVAATAGRLLMKNGIYLSRITVLDPAAPLFYKEKHFTSPRCAAFIDAIHTNVGIYGKTTAVADIDFYANFVLFQKGCSLTDVACHHSKASEFYAESITTLAGFWGYPLEGQKHIELMGEYVPFNAHGGYYISTNPSRPYATGTTFPNLFKIVRDDAKAYIAEIHSQAISMLTRVRLVSVPAEKILRSILEKLNIFFQELWHIY